MDFDQAAIALKRAKQQTVHRSNFPKEVREKLLTEKIEYYTKKVLTPVVENTKQLLEKIIALHAELFTLRVEDENGQLTHNESKIEKEMKQYYTNCYRVTAAVETLQQAAGSAKVTS